MKPLDELANDAQAGDVVLFYLDGDVKYVGFRQSDLSKLLFASTQGGKSRAIDVSKRAIDGRSILGYELLKAKRRKDSHSSTPSPQVEVSDTEYGGMGGPFRNSYDRELREEEDKQNREQARRRKKQEDDLGYERDTEHKNIPQ